MTAPIPINTAQMVEFLTGLLNTPSPTGFTEAAIAYCEREFARFGFPLRRTVKGALVFELPGRASDAPRALTAHVDTLGAMVKEIKPNGRLKLTKLGGFHWNTVESEGCTVFTHTGPTVRGSLLVTKASSHIFGAETGKAERDDDGMEVRLDARTQSADQTRALGIEVGDGVAFDPRVEVGPAGFIRSRHLDDKAAVACIFGALNAVVESGVQPAQRTTIHISNYEEVGHGAASGFPPDLIELLTIDMAAVGPGQASDEFSACICVKDSGGPYHNEMNRKLRALAEDANIPYTVDIYPYYGSDGEAYWRAGGDVRVGLIGPGVDASHNYERTHTDSLMHTAQLIAQYLRE
ncbi:MAG: M42 family metallopeptidase [Anaerolineales bacterium]